MDSAPWPPVGDDLLDLLQIMKDAHQGVTIASPDIVSAIWFKQAVDPILRHKHRYAIGEAIRISHTLLNTVFFHPFIIVKQHWITRESERVSRGPLLSSATALIEREWYTYPCWFRAIPRLFSPTWTPWWRLSFLEKYSLWHQTSKPSRSARLSIGLASFIAAYLGEPHLKVDPFRVW